MYAAAWRPGLVVCAACLVLLTLPARSVATRTCDGCGHVCAGVDAGDPIHPCAVGFGSLIYRFGVCGGCRPDLPF